MQSGPSGPTPLGKLGTEGSGGTAGDRRGASGELATLKGLQVTGGIINGEQSGNLNFNQVSEGPG